MMARQRDDGRQRYDVRWHARNDGRRRRQPSCSRPSYHQDSPSVRLPVEKLYVEFRQQVKKGDALADLFSIELARAKNDYLAARVQKENDQRNVDVRRKLVETAAISTQSWLDTQNAASKSNLAYQTARDNLLLLGLNEESIAAVDKEAGEQKARTTLRSPVDGVISQVENQDGDLCDAKHLLLVIEANAPGTEKPTSDN